MLVYVVITEDRHTDVDVAVFEKLPDAVEHAQVEAEANTMDKEFIEKEPLTPEMLADSWVLFLVYSPEGDSVRVVSRELQKGEP